jgi:hypothetical protein
MAFTTSNTEGFSENQLNRMNTISAAIRFANADLHGNAVEDAIGRVFDPALSDVDNARQSLEVLGRA